MSTTRFEYLFNCYINNNYTKEEKEELMAMLMQPENEAKAQSIIDKVIEDTGSEMQIPDRVATSILQNILQKDKDFNSKKNKKSSFLLWTSAAAAVIFLLAGAAYLIFNKNDDTKVKALLVAEKALPVLPGGNRALLTVSDGSTIILDSTQSGVLRHEGSTRIVKKGDVLIYNTDAVSKSNPSVAYNTLSTPMGGQYQVDLPDGSRVWLNAGSSLHFPTNFPGSQRQVELAGEAYFEVAKNRAQPFEVKVGDIRVHVLGTHFNINAYTDENVIRTSLLEGSVKIINGQSSGKLNPGQQAILNKNEKDITIKKVDMGEVIAWKNGLFQFEGADIATIMRQISRWYNVEIIYAGKVPVRLFEGKISRNAQLEEVLQILQLSNVKFQLEGKKIIVQ